MMKIVKATLLSYVATHALIITEQYSQRNVNPADFKQFAKIAKINKPLHAGLAEEELCCDIKYMQHMEIQQD